MTPRRSGKDVNPNWWTENTDLHEHVWESARVLDGLSSGRRQDDLRHTRLYSNRAWLQLSMTAHNREQARTIADAARLTLNVIRSCVDTACAKISQARPRPLFLTSGGDWKLKKRAQQLTKFMDGLFDAEGVYPLGQSVFRDSLVTGTGCVKVFQNGQRVCFERVHSGELLLDDGEAHYGKPRTLYQRRFLSRDVLKARFPGHAGDVDLADSAFSKEDAANPNLITVVEAWHLPSSPDAKDGQHVVSISNATLVDEPWTRDHFPFAFLRWSEPVVGFWGMGLAEELTGIQIEINKILRNIQAAQNIMSVPRVFVEAGSSVNGASLQANPEGLSVVRYQGQAPNFLTAQAMPGEVYAHLDRLERKAFEITGVSQLSAQSKKPAGLDSGVAIREFQDIESERFVLVGQRYEAFYLDLARLAVESAQELYEAKPDLNVLVATKGRSEKIAWKDVQLKRDQYLLRCFPTSLLPTTPAGRLQKVQELVQAGFLDRDEGLALLDFPDLEGSMSIVTSAFNDAMRAVEAILEDGEYQTPEPYMNLPLLIRVAQGAYLRARADGVPEERLELLRRLIDDAAALQREAQPKAQEQAPIALPEAPPTSDLLPVAPGNATPLV
jgi:hypothetical protein